MTMVECENSVHLKALFLAQNAPLTVWGRALPGPSGKLTVLPQILSWTKLATVGPRGKGEKKGAVA